MSVESTVEDLWRSLSGGLRGWFRGHGADAEEAEDLLLETFLRVQRSLEQVSDDARYPAWVRRVARNVWIDRLRRDVPGEAPSDVPSDVASDVPGHEAEPDLTAEVAGWLEPAIAGLADARTAEILRRTELGGETQAAVAADLGMSVGAVKARVRRGRQRLRESLEACCSFEFDRRGGLIDARPRRRDCDC